MILPIRLMLYNCATKYLILSVPRPVKKVMTVITAFIVFVFSKILRVRKRVKKLILYNM